MKLLAPLFFAALLAQPVAAELAFREVGEAWGLDFRHRHGGSGERYMVETMGSGVALFDYDGDGDLDVFFVDGGELPSYEGPPPRSRLLRNDGGRFVDVTESSGIVVEAYGMGAAVADVDGDGDLDLYVTAFGANQLFENQGDGTFRDVTEKAGVGDERWSASAAFADFDLDGDLDLYVANYVELDLENRPRCFNEAIKESAYCHPDYFEAVGDVLYRNRGDGTFEDVTDKAGLGGLVGKGLGVVAADFDGDHRPDLYVANDTTPNFFFHNKGSGLAFEDATLLSGAGFSDLGAPEAGMGVAVGDADGDGLADLFVTNFALETNALYRNLGGGLFADQRFASGLGEPSIATLAFGTSFADLESDGDLDLVVANGHILDNVDRMEMPHGISYRQPNQVFENQGRGKFRELRDVGFERREASRGLAVGDLDGDGDLDLVFTNSNAVAEVYENASAQGAWLRLDVLNGAGAPAVGTEVEIEVGESKQKRELVTATSYLSQGESTLHFGLGGAERVERVRIRWSDGKVREIRNLPVSRRLRVSTE